MCFMYICIYVCIMCNSPGTIYIIVFVVVVVVAIVVVWRAMGYKNVLKHLLTVALQVGHSG